MDTLEEPAEIRLRPLYTALLTKVLSCVIIELKSDARIDCWLAVLAGLDDSITFFLMSASRSETDVAPAIAAATTPRPEDSDCCTASNDLRSARRPWAIEKLEASSLGPMTL